MEQTCYNDFKNNLDAYVNGILTHGHALRVTTDDGAFVVVEEAEFKILRDAMELLLKNA